MRPELTVRETLELYAGYYSEPRGHRRRRSTYVGLTEKAEPRARRSPAASCGGWTSAWR